VRDKGIFGESIRRGESSDAFIRRALRKMKKEGVMNDIRDPSRGTGECRNISKPSAVVSQKLQEEENGNDKIEISNYLV
jgi:hypothetical protein